ncbi:MAG: D-alanine--D-alanine ligase [Candidatus Eremiobacteraeota bacterium]|nr:D-alanine--D-alanine ligase [Candidatus Eremiobacteraeota bacterium]
MNDKPLVAVVMGGMSAERAISLQTGTAVCHALEMLGYRFVTIDFDDAFVDSVRAHRPAAVFNALHGGAGEDGTVAALLEWLKVPYQGSGVLASAVAMDKWLTKAVMRFNDIPTPTALLLHERPDRPVSLPERVGFPCVVKPAAQGSAVGVAIVRSAQELNNALRAAGEHGQPILAERYIEGREFTIAILDDQALPVVEIQPRDSFYTYESKYTPGASVHTAPARIPPERAACMQDFALRLHRALGCRDYSRVDLLADASLDSLYVLECNALPGLTPLSLFPDAAAAVGISFEALIDTLVRSALSRCV